MTTLVVGGGAMGEALLAGWIASGVPAAEIGVVEPSAARAADLVARHGVREATIDDAASAEVVALLPTSPTNGCSRFRVVNIRMSSKSPTVASGKPASASRTHSGGL